LATSGVAWYRRGKLAPEERFRASFNIRLPFWQGQSMTGKVLSVVLAVVIAGAIGTLEYAIITPQVGESSPSFISWAPKARPGIILRN